MISYEIITDTDDIDILLGKESTFANLHYKYDKETVDMLKKYFLRSDSLYLIGTDNGSFVAFCSLDSDWWESGYFFLREIFVMPEYQSRNIGLELIQRSIQHAKDHEAVGVVTETAFENIPMQKLCEKCGFEQWDNPEWKEGITYKLNFDNTDS